MEGDIPLRLPVNSLVSYHYFKNVDIADMQSWGLRITEEIIHRVIDTLRAESYPPMADYLDSIVKGDDAQKQKYLDDCLAVKQKYPKFSW